ncbi:hypothetical protein QE152_g15624 [Popillia japonica]|uniref:Uncharacterized protein n=1 Tax=Popillia japonica TaxID=7064 RepID=A0AAW1L539_POPJA
MNVIKKGLSDRSTRRMLNRMHFYPYRRASRNGTIPCPASSDLLAPDYLLCAYLKLKVFVNTPKTLR